MKTFILILIIGTSSIGFGQTKAYKKMLTKYYTDFPTIAISDAYEHLKQNDAHFLDIRTQKEFDVSHIKNATNMNPDGSSIRTLKGIGKGDLIIVYCSVGARSQDFGEKLVNEGYTNVKNLYGGLFLWANREYPMVDSNKKRTTDIHGFSEDWGKWVKKGKVIY